MAMNRPCVACGSYNDHAPPRIGQVECDIRDLAIGCMQYRAANIKLIKETRKLLARADLSFIGDAYRHGKLVDLIEKLRRTI